MPTETLNYVDYEKRKNVTSTCRKSIDIDQLFLISHFYPQNFPQVKTGIYNANKSYFTMPLFTEMSDKTEKDGVFNNLLSTILSSGNKRECLSSNTKLAKK